MAHFAKIENGTVTQVIVVDNEILENKEFPESEAVGKNYLKSIGLRGEWLQTSYNGNFRKNYASIGYTYDQKLDMFISPKPYNSWYFSRKTLQWEPPVTYPYTANSSVFYKWNEEQRRWDVEKLTVDTTKKTRLKAPYLDDEFSSYEGNENKE